MTRQSITLLKYLRTGRGITRETAAREFGIQNLTARLAELKAHDADIIKSVTNMQGPGGRKMRVTRWWLRHVFKEGDAVQVTEDSLTFINYRGWVGRVMAPGKTDCRILVELTGTSGQRLYRIFPSTALRPVKHLPPGTPVEITAQALVVGEYVLAGDSYLLLTPDPNVTIAASAAVVRPVAPHAPADAGHH